MRKLALFCITVLFCVAAQAQSLKLVGKVYNEKNEPLAGVNVQVTGGEVTASNVIGAFQLNLATGKKYEITFSAVGYQPKIVGDVEVGEGLSNELNITLVVANIQQEGVTVTARTSQRRETVNSILQFQKNTNTVASVVSAETIRRSPDRNTGEVLKRTSGASIQEGRFIVVRGLADRYNQAMLNGVLLTSTEPDRKTFSFDLIPAPMIDNIVINKAFVPEFPGEWAGGLIQVNTKDIPARNFFNIQVGTGFNTQTIGKPFYKDQGGKWDWIGIDDGTRGLPSSYTTKSNFDILPAAEKTAIGKQMRNAWKPLETGSAPLNVSFQANGGFSSKVWNKTVSGVFGLLYTKNNRRLELLNRQNSLSGTTFSLNYNYDDERYSQDVSVGGLAGLTVILNPANKISGKAVINLNSANFVTNRSGYDIARGEDLFGSELTFRQNTFFSSQLVGDHSISKAVKLKWYGSFNILDAHSPDQRRILYSKASNSQDPYRLLISNTLSQQSGSRIFQDLSDYIYTAGGDLSYTYTLFNQKQTLKGGYMFQVKDRLYDAKLFAVYLPLDNDPLKQLPADQVFAPQNFGNGTGTLFGFDAIKGNTFRYLANTILNAGYVQFDNQFSPDLRVVWGLRAENYDQLVGSVKAWDPRHVHREILDFLPGLNATLRLDAKTNLRLSASQTVIRPELRELASLNLYDFELNASVQGKPTLDRTKVTNADLRYEIYPRAGEVFSAGLFYKYFKNPIEQLFNEGSGGASTFTFNNVAKAMDYGVEVEFRKKLDFVSALSHFTFQGNAAYIYSRIKDENLKVDRPLQGQSPYLVNLGLLYDLEKQGLIATVLFNQIGKRIYLVGDLTSGSGSPDIYEASRPLLDFQLAKKIIHNKGEIKLNISDILNQTQYFYQNADDNTKFEKNKDVYRFTRRTGSTFGITFNYSL